MIRPNFRFTSNRVAPGKYDVWEFYIDPHQPHVGVYSVRGFLYLLCSKGTRSVYLPPISPTKLDVQIGLMGPYRRGEKPGSDPVQLRAGYTLQRQAVHDPVLGLDADEKALLAKKVVEKLDLSTANNRQNASRFPIALDLEDE